ncbi:hypothetical protein XELAEV_18044015mg [Xenopus laevis]|uniref:Uncharacterized protein n=1 Tax=Xenopus laevis TaxID=8355 RepID=A0A974BXZ4_XENLA|nr:hypothetical protein XELAEV_18044015mg [Xenopus laevis]
MSDRSRAEGRGKVQGYNMTSLGPEQKTFLIPHKLPTAWVQSRSGAWRGHPRGNKNDKRKKESLREKTCRGVRERMEERCERRMRKSGMKERGEVVREG